MEESAAAPRWSVFTNHGHVLLHVARDPDARVRDIAEAVGITQRSVQVILKDLRAAGYVSATARGRRNHYTILPGTQLHHPLEGSWTVGDLLVV